MALRDQKVKFDVAVDGRVPLRDAILMGLQNTFVMTGIFVFPGIMGRSFDLPPETIAQLYGATFIGAGVTSLLIGGLFGKMPLPCGPYAGIFTALLTFGHMPGSNLGTAFGSLLAASLLWAVLSIPIRGLSVVSILTRAIGNPAITGTIVMIVMMQIADLSLPHWIGTAKQPTFPLINFVAGFATALVLMTLTVLGIPILRRLALLIGLVTGTVLFESFHPIDFAPIAHAQWFVLPPVFPFGIGFNPIFCAVFFGIMVAINIQTVTLMSVVAEWGDEPMDTTRLSRGVLAMALGSAVSACIGNFSNLPYPANVAMLRATRVASRHVTVATGAILVIMGFCSKIDFLFVLMPVAVLAAGATVLFGAVFVHGVEMLAGVEWDERRLVAVGFALMLAFGSLFIEPETLKEMPILVGLLLRQPVIIGVTTLLLIGWLLPSKPRAAAA